VPLHTPHLSLDLLEHLPNLIITVHLPDTLATTTPTGLEHDRVTDLLAALNGLVRSPDTSLQDSASKRSARHLQLMQ
jgi:hypothetical protein